MPKYAEHIRELRRSLNLNQDEMAQKLGVTQATISRWEKGLQEPGSNYVVELASALGLSPTEFLHGTDESNPVFSNRIPIAGEVQAGEWKEVPLSAQFDDDVIILPEDYRFPGFDRVALKVKGRSMNRVYPEGTILVCVAFVELDRDPQSGENVVVLRTDRQGLIEATVKEYFVSEDGEAYLWPRSDDPEYQQPLKIDRPGATEDGDDVQIRALVIGSYRPE